MSIQQSHGATVSLPAGTWSYGHDGLGKRTFKWAPGNVLSRYLYGAEGTLLAETNPGGTTLTSIYLWLNGQPIGLVRGGQVYQVHADHLGRPELLTNSSKAIVWRAENLAFDRRVATTSIGGYNLGFPGQYYDAEGASWQNWFRTYDGSIGRYTQSDPIGLAGGLNTYAYVMGAPTIAVDTMGLETCLLTTVGPGGIRDHAAIHVSQGDGSGGPALYDPAGSFARANGGGSGDLVTGEAASIDRFKEFHGSQVVESSCKDTSRAEEEAIVNAATRMPPAGAFQCAVLASAVLSGQPSFPHVKGGTFWPGNLLRQVRRNRP